jgi:hypothetical protein
VEVDEFSMSLAPSDYDLAVILAEECLQLCDAPFSNHLAQAAHGYGNLEVLNIFNFITSFTSVMIFSVSEVAKLLELLVINRLCLGYDGEFTMLVTPKVGYDTCHFLL